MDKWYLKNSLDNEDVFEYLKKWMEYYNIDNYDLTVGDGYTALRVIRHGVSYIAIPEPQNCRLRVVSGNKAGCSKGIGFHVVKSMGEGGYINGDNCWVKFFKEISRK